MNQTYRRTAGAAPQMSAEPTTPRDGDDLRRSGPETAMMPLAEAAAPILDKLKQVMPQALEETAEERAERLKGLPPTTVVANMLSQFAEAQRNLTAVGMVKQRARIEAKIAELERLHRQCIERDVAQAELPEGCFCFGSGGRGECAYPGRRVGEYVLGWREYCPCEVGAAQKAELGEIKRERLAHDREREIARSMGEHMRVPGRLKEFTIDSWAAATLARGNHPDTVADLVDAGRAWLDAADPDGRPTRWLVLWGPMGCGKTGYGAGLLRVLAERRVTCVFISVPDLLGEIKDTYGRRDGKSEADIRAGAGNADLLFLDDAGAHYTKDDEGWAQEVLYRVIDHRYNAKLPTILTCNLAPGDKLAEKLGRRSYHRLVEVADFLEIDGPSLREPLLLGR